MKDSPFLYSKFFMSAIDTNTCAAALFTAQLNSIFVQHTTSSDDASVNDDNFLDSCNSLARSEITDEENSSDDDTNLCAAKTTMVCKSEPCQPTPSKGKRYRNENWVQTSARLGNIMHVKSTLNRICECGQSCFEQLRDCVYACEEQVGVCA